MLNFSKIKVLIIYLTFSFIAFFSLLNLQSENNPILNKKINLGLDLQGGSYLLLEVDTNPLISDRIQQKVLPIKKLLKENCWLKFGLLDQCVYSQKTFCFQESVVGD